MITWLCYRLEEILLQDGKLFLVFEFLSMDLKKYLDSLPSGQFMDKMAVKVRYCMQIFQLKLVSKMSNIIQFF